MYGFSHFQTIKSIKALLHVMLSLQKSKKLIKTLLYVYLLYATTSHKVMLLLLFLLDKLRNHA